MGSKDGEVQIFALSKDGETEFDLANNPSKDGEDQNTTVDSKDGEVVIQTVDNKDGEVETEVVGNKDGGEDQSSVVDNKDGIPPTKASGMMRTASSGFTPQSFMASIDYNPQFLAPYTPPQSRDYLAELIARLQK